MAETITREAQARDAAAAVEVLRRSIIELCVADHQGDPETLAKWLSNKTEERFRAWIDSPEQYLVVAERAGALCGVGMLGGTGEIQLCYVMPGLASQGVGRALLQALETQAEAWGLSRLQLSSTIGAKRFYERAGYRPTGKPTTGFGITECHPYEKHLGGAS